MPTITITCPTLPPSRRRAVAVRLTRWLVDRGASPAHVVVRFEEWPAASVMVGGMPAEALPPVGGGAARAAGEDTVPYASVRCQVAPDRDEEFRDGLADRVAEALGVGDGTAFFYLEFVATDPACVHLYDATGLHRAGRVPSPVHS